MGNEKEDFHDCVRSAHPHRCGNGDATSDNCGMMLLAIPSRYLLCCLDSFRERACCGMWFFGFGRLFVLSFVSKEKGTLEIGFWEDGRS